LNEELIKIKNNNNNDKNKNNDSLEISKHVENLEYENDELNKKVKVLQNTINEKCSLEK
jgi:uncharacterized protein YlxW (UPF0749 family)